jgi:polysaccharide biosynthesis/export protein
MRIKYLLLSAIAFFTFANLAFADAYKLHHGDAVFISVWGEDTLQKEVRVLPDGSLTFPLAGRVDVANQTTTDVEKNITSKLKAYLNDPQVTVVVTKTDGNLAYVIGKVAKTGPVLLSGPTTVLQALSLAGGFDKFADLGSIKVLRNQGGKQTTINVNYNMLIKGESLSSNILLEPGDTILIP